MFLVLFVVIGANNKFSTTRTQKNSLALKAGRLHPLLHCIYRACVGIGPRLCLLQHKRNHGHLLPLVVDLLLRSARLLHTTLVVLHLNLDPHHLVFKRLHPRQHLLQLFENLRRVVACLRAPELSDALVPSLRRPCITAVSASDTCAPSASRRLLSFCVASAAVASDLTASPRTPQVASHSSPTQVAPAAAAWLPLP